MGAMSNFTHFLVSRYSQNPPGDISPAGRMTQSELNTQVAQVLAKLEMSGGVAWRVDMARVLGRSRGCMVILVPVVEDCFMVK